MFRPRIIPVLLLKDEGLVKTVGFSNTTYIGDPINSIKIFNDMEADELVFLDIRATKECRSILPSLVKKISEEAYMPFSVGGGIKTFEEAKNLILAGAEKVVINSEFSDNPYLIREISEYFGSQAVIVAIDVKGGKVFTKSGSEEKNISPAEQARKAEKFGAGEILVQSIDKDGQMAGYDLSLIQEISHSVNIPVIALGGAGNYEDFKKAVAFGASAVSAGSLFVYHGARKGILINYPSKTERSNIFDL